MTDSPATEERAKNIEVPGDRLCMYCGQPKADHARPEDADDPRLLSCEMRQDWSPTKDML